MRSDSIQSIYRNPKFEIKPKLHRYPPKRWGHTAVLNANKLYIYGGKTGKLKEPLYELDCDTFQSHIHEISGFPESRESHSCSLIKGKLLIWGGCRQEKALNDCVCITIKDRHCMWSQIAQFPTLKQRQSHSTTVLKQKYILLYGGSNQELMYEDFWVFNTELEIWFEIKNIVNKMKKRLGCTLTTIRDRVYMFGGQTEDQTYQNQLYCLTFSDLEFNNKDRIPQMRCQKIQSVNGIVPGGRSCHSAVVYENRYLIVLAGEGLEVKGKQGKDKGGKGVTVLLNDVWSFDTERNTWQMIQIPNRNIFKPRSCFTANLYRNKILIFGGLISTQNFKPSDQLLTLSLTESTQKPLQICNLCKLHYKQPDQHIIQKQQQIQITSRQSFSFHLSNLYKLSRMIKNPFDAICLILEGFHRLKYRKVNVDVVEGKLVMVQGVGVEIQEEKFLELVGKYEFVEEVWVDDPKILDALEFRIQQQSLQIFGFNIKNGCSRLGHTYFLANRRGSLIDLCLTLNQTIFYTQINLQDISIISPTQQSSYQIIKNYMHRNNLNISLLQDKTFTIVITDLQKISPMQSQLRVNGKGYVENAGIGGSGGSGSGGGSSGSGGKRGHLQGYCAGLFLRGSLMQVYINSKKIQFINSQQQYIHNTYQPILQHDLKQIHLQQSQSPNTPSYISIYRQGIRVGRYQHNKKQSLNIHTSSKNNQIINIQGYIEVSLHYQLNILRNKIENSRFVQIQLEKICEEFREGLRKRGSDVGVGELQGRVGMGERQGRQGRL